MHIRMGDGAKGTSVPVQKWFAHDLRLSHHDALHMIACALLALQHGGGRSNASQQLHRLGAASNAATVNATTALFVATDNSYLRRALTRHEHAASDAGAWPAWTMP